MNTTLILTLAFAASAPALKDTPKEPTVFGEWALVESLLGGQPDKAQPTVEKIVITENKWIIYRVSNLTTSTDIAFHPKATPPQLDFGVISGRPPCSQCIYKLDGDTLTVCYTVSGERPGQFSSPPGSQTQLLTLKRLKKNKP